MSKFYMISYLCLVSLSPKTNEQDDFSSDLQLSKYHVISHLGPMPLSLALRLTDDTCGTSDCKIFGLAHNV